MYEKVCVCCVGVCLLCVCPQGQQTRRDSKAAPRGFSLGVCKGKSTGVRVEVSHACVCTGATGFEENEVCGRRCLRQSPRAPPRLAPHFLFHAKTRKAAPARQGRLQYRRVHRSSGGRTSPRRSRQGPSRRCCTCGWRRRQGPSSRRGHAASPPRCPSGWSRPQPTA